MLMPVKAFSLAKTRLADALDASERAALARRMASAVLAAAAGLPVTVVCDDEEVARWASANGAAVVWAPGLGLNGAVTAGVDALARAEMRRVVVALADLPRARDLGAFAAVSDESAVVVVPDRHEVGTNVLSVPTGRGFRFSFGRGSLRRHMAEAERLGLSMTILRPPDLTWDVDVPADLLWQTSSAAHPTPTSAPRLARSPAEVNVTTLASGPPR